MSLNLYNFMKHYFKISVYKTYDFTKTVNFIMTTDCHCIWKNEFILNVLSYVYNLTRIGNNTNIKVLYNITTVICFFGNRI